MRNFSSLFFFLFLFIFLFFAGLLVQGQSSVSPLKNHNYYVNNKGSDSNSGDKSYPFHSIDHINKMRFSPGDKIFFSGGQNFHGKLTLDSSSGGLENNPISLDVYGRGKANIYSGAQLAISLYKKNYLLINHLHLIGAGRKLGNHSSGLALINCKKIILKNCEINGFQKSGLQIFASEDIVVDNILAHDNGYAGISVEGNYQQKDSKNILIQNSKAFNNPGDPTNLTSHSGNGIVVGSCKGVVIQFCTATANGWDMPRKGNGPVGIWAFEADSILIQHCISYKNRTSKGGEDGGGFDLDGGVTNSVIQYCLSYGNEGSGFGIFQYAGASPWYNNTIRCNISENDGNVSTAKASVYIWNGSKNKNEFTRCYFYNNTVYNAKGSAISYATDSENDSFYFYNNIFVAGKDLIIGNIFDSHYLGNNLWNWGGAFSSNGQHSFLSWARKYNFEIEGGRIIGFNINPHFKRPGSSTQISAQDIRYMNFYRLPAGSILKHGGINLDQQGVKWPVNDYNQKRFIKGLIGACS